MRVLFVISDLALHGAQKQVVELSRELARFGHEVAIYTLNADAPRARELQGSGVEVVVDQKRSRLDLALLARLRRRILAMRAQIVQGVLFDGDIYARIAAFGTSGLDPATMGMGPVPASRKALQRAGWNVQDVNLFELNEAFAAQACAVNKELGIDPSKVNVNGGAIAIGHPIGASGCRILVTLLHEMQRREAKKGLAALCIGGGEATAIALELA